MIQFNPLTKIERYAYTKVVSVGVVGRKESLYQFLPTTRDTEY